MKTCFICERRAYYSDRDTGEPLCHLHRFPEEYGKPWIRKGDEARHREILQWHYGPARAAKIMAGDDYSSQWDLRRWRSLGR